MTIQTENLILAAHLPRYLRALIRSEQEFENIAGLRVAAGIRDQMLSASAEFMARVETAKQSDPWQFGFAVIRKIDNEAGGSRATWTGKPARVDERGRESINVLIGICGFPGPPDANGVAEIAYGIAPSYRGKGYATEAAMALIEFARKDPRVKTIRAHTLAEPNASTRILQKCGFKKTGDAVDPENNLAVWRWELAALPQVEM